MTILWIVIAVVWLVGCWLVARFAGKRGHSFWAFFALAMLTSWATALIVTLVIPDQATTQDPASLTRVRQAPAGRQIFERVISLREG